MALSQVNCAVKTNEAVEPKVFKFINAVHINGSEYQ